MRLETYHKLLGNLFTWEIMFCKKWAEEIQIWRCIYECRIKKGIRLYTRRNPF